MFTVIAIAKPWTGTTDGFFVVKTINIEGDFIKPVGAIDFRHQKTIHDLHFIDEVAPVVSRAPVSVA